MTLLIQNKHVIKIWCRSSLCTTRGLERLTRDWASWKWIKSITLVYFFTVLWGPSLCNIYQILLCTIQREGAFSGSFSITTKTGISIHWVDCCTLFQFFLVLVNKMSLLGGPSCPWFCSWTKKKTEFWAISACNICANSYLHFAIPVLVSHSYSVSCFLICSCPSCSIISIIFLTFEVLPGNYVSL